MSPKELFSLLVRMHQHKLINCLLILLFALSIGNEIAIYNIGLITGDYYRILNDKDQSAFFRQTIKSLLLIVCISLLKSFKECVASFLYIEWRDKLTADLHDNYFLNQAFYQLNVLNASQQASFQPNNKTQSNDNIDQRITQDVDKLTNSLSSIIPEILVSPFIIVFYSYRCYSVSGLVGPVGCVVFFLLSTIINKLLIKQVSRFVYAQERCEGDFRFQHVHVRSNAESIALLSGQSMEKVKCSQYLTKLIRTQRSLVVRQFFLKCSVNLSDYLGSILSFIAISVPLFAGLYDNLKPSELSKLISENSFFTIYLINCFTRLIDLAVFVSIFHGTANRIVDLYKWFTENTSTLSRDVTSSTNDSDHEDIYFDCADVCIETPDTVQNRTIIRNLTFQIKAGQNLIITGPSGSGKSSLIRALKKLWPLTGGQIKRYLVMDNPNSVMFIPSKPVLLSGSLAEQLVYPKVFRPEDYQMDSSFQERVLSIMRFLELEESLLERLHYDIFLDPNLNWIDHLSAGEVQRLSLARVLYHRPQVVFLDEATTALPEEMERKILTELIANSITMVSCGHRQGLRNFHHTELRFVNAGTFQLFNLQNN